MMEILPLRPEIKEYLQKRNLEKQFAKQKRLFEKNPFYPSLRTELLEPRKMKIWSFRIDQKYGKKFKALEDEINYCYPDNGLKCFTTSDDYCVQVRLTSGEDYYCIDSTGYAGASTTEFGCTAATLKRKKK